MAKGFTEADVNRLLAKRAGQPVDTKPQKRKKTDQYTPYFNALCDARGLPRPVPEARFHETRKWAIDFYWPNERVAVEVDGAIWTGGRHTRGSGWVADAEKRRAMAAAGILLVPITPDDVATGIWVEPVREAMRWTRIKGTP